MSTAASGEGASGGLLGAVERLGNRLPDPATLFLLATLLVMALSQAAASLGWAVEKTTLDASGPVTVRVEPVSLLTSDGLHWVVSNLVANFRDFPPLAIVLVGMLGIGLAERSGFLPSLLRAALARVPARWLAPIVVFVGVVSSLAVDAGYVVVPPIAAALFQAAGRSPIAGIAAAFAGVAGGFGANLVPTGLDPLLAGLTESGARLAHPGYTVAPTCNWWLMAVSTLVLTVVGGWVTDRVVEPRLRAAGAAAGDPAEPPAPFAGLGPDERRGLRAGLLVLALTLAAMALAVLIPGAPLHGTAGKAPRWVAAIVPLLFFALALPGLAHGVAARTIRSDRDAARMLSDTMAGLGPYLVLAFFAAQFVACFGQSRLGEMLAIAGGELLARAALPTPLLLALFVVAVAFVNLVMASSSAKYAFLAPVFVPMFMQVGVSPELTQAAYRVGDSITNAVAPLNPYQVIVLMLLQRYARHAGIGTLVATMLPYALAFGVVWTALLALWVALGLPLGPEGPLTYPAGGGLP
ncbi:MAG TPA: AbgT family transporter [Myxococcota bacterium]|nr:AbgT family transporter [Myxococcota bacterium]